MKITDVQFAPGFSSFFFDDQAAIKSGAVGLWIVVLAGAAWAVPRICKQSTAVQPPRYLNQVVVQVGTTDKSAYFQVARLRIDVAMASAVPR